MSRAAITGVTRVAGVVGAPVSHSLSPLIHNAWLSASGADGVYVAFSPQRERFETFVDGWRAGSLAGLNVTAPFKERAARLADVKAASALIAGAANLLLFHPDGSVEAHNTDAEGLLAALAEDAPMWPAAGPIAVLGAGGAAKGAVAALREAGQDVRVVNRSPDRAHALAARFEGVKAFGMEDVEDAFHGAFGVINTLPVDLSEASGRIAPLHLLPGDAFVLDMVYTPLRTPLLAAAQARQLATIDGLSMLIAQARPSYRALFGHAPPETVDVRALALATLGARP